MNESFTNKFLAKKLRVSIRLAQKITYCLRKMDLIAIAGKKRKELLFKVEKKLFNKNQSDFPEASYFQEVK